MGKRTSARFRAITSRGAFRLSLPLPDGDWVLEYKSLAVGCYSRFSDLARGILILVTLIVGNRTDSIYLPVGVSATDGLAEMLGEKPFAVAKAIAELTGPMGCLILIGGSPDQGVSIKPNWRPAAKWSAAWRSFQRTLYGEGWKCPVRARRRVLARDGQQCRYCRLDVAGRLTLDHVQPRALGGTDTVENLVVACRKCNLRKGKRTPEQANMVLLPVPESRS